MRPYFILFTLLIGPRIFAQTICIDPGHGYGPNGEDIDGRTETEIFTNCAVGLLLRDSLESHGYTVIMTREDSDSGSWMSLTQRAELADEYESERLLSIHCNAGGGTGTETFWCYRNSPNKAIDSTFSLLVQNNMSYYGEWKSRRSIEDFDYLGFHLGVLKGAAPGCLSEIGFVDTPGDSEKLLNEDWRKVFAQAYRVSIDESFQQDYPSGIVSIDNSSFQVFPLPFNDYIYIQTEDKGFSFINIELLNLSGQVVKQKIIREQTGNRVELRTDVPDGVYILRIGTFEGSFSRIVIKMGM